MPSHGSRDAMSFDHLMESFAQKNDMGKLEFKDNKYHLVLDDLVALTAFQAGGNCYLHGILGSLPDQPRDQEQLLIELLKTSLILVSTHRVSLCIEPDNKQLGLYLVRSLQDLDEAELERGLIEYLNCFEILQEYIEKQQPLRGNAPMMLMP